MHLIHEYGLVAVAAIIGLECLGLPVPGETALLAAAIYAGTKHDLNINAVIVTAAGAAMAGRMIGTSSAINSVPGCCYDTATTSG